MNFYVVCLMINNFILIHILIYEASLISSTRLCWIGLVDCFFGLLWREGEMIVRVRIMIAKVWVRVNGVWTVSICFLLIAMYAISCASLSMFEHPISYTSIFDQFPLDNTPQPHLTAYFNHTSSYIFHPTPSFIFEHQ